MGYYDKEIKGKTVKAAFINADKTIVRLECEDGVIHLECEGDCCSETWIEHAHGAESMIGCIIAEVEQKDLGEAIPTRQESDQLYSMKIKTTQPEGYKGYRYHDEFAIEFRNSSNGYYGGTLNIGDGPPELPEGFVALKDF